MGSVGNAWGELYGQKGVGNGMDRALGVGGDAPNQGTFAELSGEGLNMAKQASQEYTDQADNRKAFANQLAQGAQGQGPSLAQMQLQAAQDRGLAQQVAAAKANRASNPALAARQSAQLGAQMQQATAQNSAQARLAEQRQQQQAYQQYLGGLQSARVGALNAASGATSAGSANQMAHDKSQKEMYGNMFNAGSDAIGSIMGSDRNMKTDIKKEGKGYAEGGLVLPEQPEIPEIDPAMQRLQESLPTPQGSFFDSSKAPEQTQEMPKAQDYGYYSSLFAPTITEKHESKGGKGGGGAGLMSMFAMMSDEKNKKDIKAIVPGEAEVAGDHPANDTIKAKLSPGEMVIPRSEVAKGADAIKAFAEATLKANKGESKQKADKHEGAQDMSPKSFLDALQAYSYKYKGGMAEDPRGGEGRYLSVMAQDLEKAGPVGESMVKETPEGKVVDYSKGFGAILAAQADLNKRLNEIEAKRKKS